MNTNPFFESNSIRGVRYIPWSLEFPPPSSHLNISEYEQLLKDSNRKNWIYILDEMKYLLFCNLEIISLDYDINNYANEDIDVVLRIHDEYTTKLVTNFIH